MTPAWSLPAKQTLTAARLQGDPEWLIMKQIMTSVPRPPAPAPIGLSPPDAIAWPRYVMGLVLLALSFATSQQSGHHPADAAQPAVPQPVPERLVTGAPLALLEPLVRRTAADSAVPPRATAASGVTGPRADAPLQLATRQRIHRRPVHARALRSAAAATRSAGPWSMRYDQVAAAKLARGRIGVQREYIAARERVAALTGEDSGSVFLARQAGRARAGPMAHGRHGHRTAT